MDVLPAGFEFRHYIDGPALYLAGEIVANACPANPEPGAPWRLCIAPRKWPRYEYLASEAACRRYMAAWARRWEAEIRVRVAASDRSFEHLALNGPVPVTRHPRGKARRRGIRL